MECRLILVSLPAGAAAVSKLAAGFDLVRRRTASARQCRRP